jgi:hypothetical protein
MEHPLVTYGLKDGVMNWDTLKQHMPPHHDRYSKGMELPVDVTDEQRLAFHEAKILFTPLPQTTQADMNFLARKVMAYFGNKWPSFLYDFRPVEMINLKMRF